MKVRLTTQTLTEVTMYGMELDIPESIVDKGEAAIRVWLNQNIFKVNAAPTAHVESGSILSVSGIDTLEILSH